MTHTSTGQTTYVLDRKPWSISSGVLVWLAWTGIVALLFFRLGAAVLFEPDEGRNAEKAREILVLQDWLTPH